MTKRRIHRLTFVVLLLALGCGEDSPTELVDQIEMELRPGGPDPGAAVPDFSIPDVNATSPRFDESVSPRDYLQAVSAWYFGHAT